MDKLTKVKIKEELKMIMLLEQENHEHDDDVEMFNNTTITGICCLPSICLKNNCDIDLDTNVEL